MRKLAFLSLLPLLACGSDGTGPTHVANITVALSNTELETGQTDTAVATVLDQSGAPLNNVAVTYTSTFPEVATVNPTTGQVVAVASGRTEIIATASEVSGRKQITVSPPPLIINEVNPNGDLPNGWVELYNPTARDVDASGWTVTSGDEGQGFVLPELLIVHSGDYVAVNEGLLPSGLAASGMVHVFNKYGVQSDVYAWAGNSTGTSYARCPDGRGNFTPSSTPTRKAANVCP
jgi:hypothetical protein